MHGPICRATTSSSLQAVHFVLPLRQFPVTCKSPENSRLIFFLCTPYNIATLNSFSTIFCSHLTRVDKASIASLRKTEKYCNPIPKQTSDLSYTVTVDVLFVWCYAIPLWLFVKLTALLWAVVFWKLCFETSRTVFPQLVSNLLCCPEFKLS